MTHYEGKPTDSNPGIIMHLPDGEFVDLVHFREQEHENTRYALLTLLIKPGDLLAFQYETEDGDNAGFSFEVSDVKKERLHDTIKGRLKGLDLPRDFQDQDVLLIGSGWGGSMMSTGIVTTGRGPYFCNPETGDEYRSPIVESIEVFRKGQEGNYYHTVGVVKEME